jgi:predicted AlkP superfamily pyrophosphatase or phosphodiesterase
LLQRILNLDDTERAGGNVKRRISFSAHALALVLSAAAVSGACAPHLVSAPPSTLPSLAPDVSNPLTRHVVLVSIDGLRPDAIMRFNAPTLKKLMAEGSYTLDARTILPSKTLPSHTSMLTGEPPDRHGVMWNTAFSDRPGTLEIPTIFSLAREKGYRTAAFFSKSKFSHLQKPGSLDYSQAPGGWFGKWSADRTMRDVETYLATEKPNLLFVHLPDPDSAGHRDGWMSSSYGKAVLRADAAVARLITAADASFGAGAYTLIVTADHGGQDHDHGSDHDLDMHIPWIAWGRAVQPGELPSDSVRTTDTASTVLYLLGVYQPVTWAAKPVSTAFTAANTAQ